MGDSKAEDIAKAETADVDGCKKICEKKGFTAFVIADGAVAFKQCSREEVLAGKKKRTGSTLYVPKDPNVTDRICKAVKGEGMPTERNPFVYGNLFLILTIEFPTALDAKAAELLRKALPAAPVVRDDERSEVHFVADMDPVESVKSNAANSGGEAYDEDEERKFGAGGQRVQCNQQ